MSWETDSGFSTQLPNSWEELEARELPEWYGKAKFGIFVHWGVFSVPSWRTLNDEQFGSYAEWYYASVYGSYRNADPSFHHRMYPGKDYRDLAADFGAELFDPQAWAQLFARAGAKYVVLTSKHHDGYCLWPTSNEHKRNWNSADIGPRRDLVGDLTSAVRDAGLKMGLYYSIPEWETHRSHRVDDGYFIPPEDAEKYGINPAAYPREILHHQWVELNEKYAPSVIYTDGGEWDFDESYTDTRRMLSWLYEKAPNSDEVVVNDRFHRGMPGVHGDIFSTEYQDIEGFGTDHPWEESRGIGGSYGFNRAETAEDYSSAEELIGMLVRTVAGGGNFLLNVGPTADGRIAAIQQERLLQIGSWLETNGDAIYNSSPSTDLVTSDEGIFITKRQGARYVTVLGRPERVQLRLQEPLAVLGWELLGDDEKITEKLLGVHVDAENSEHNAGGSVSIRLGEALRWSTSPTTNLPIVFKLRVSGE